MYGFYAIRTFEKYTVPVTVADHGADEHPGLDPAGRRQLGPHQHAAAGARTLAMLTLLMTAIGVGWGISWVTWASDYSRFVPRSVSFEPVFWYSYVGHVRAHRVARHPRRHVASVTHGHRSGQDGQRGVRRRHEHPGAADGAARARSPPTSSTSTRRRWPRSARACALSRTALAADRRHRRLRGHDLFRLPPSFAKAFDNWMIGLLLWMSPWAGVVLADFYIKRKGQIDVAELYREPERERLRRHQLGRRSSPSSAGLRRRLVGRGRPRPRAAGPDLDRAARRRGPELAGRHRRGRRALSRPGPTQEPAPIIAQPMGGRR